jgi:hypothetical protein
VSISRPCAEVVSAQLSRNDPKPAFLSATAPRRLSKSLVERASRSRTGHHQDVVGTEPADQAAELLPIRLCAANLLLEDFGAACGLQLGNLRRQRLPVGRDPRLGGDERARADLTRHCHDEISYGGVTAV